ncbi:hypothetical protein D3C73_1258320 [compost metagenome]
MNRAKPSVAFPKASGFGENLGRMRWRPLKGVSRLLLERPEDLGDRVALLSANAASKFPYRGVVLMGAPVIRQQVIQHVINSHRPHKAAVVVHDWK